MPPSSVNIGHPHYEVFNLRTHEVVALRKNLIGARRFADKLDLEYGAINFGIRAVN